ncbi:glycosyltransferase [Polaribacter sp.]|uniref:glycosyltransferase n=1 Tax=Polaribacter sp. TaxID=1920175 RepID=UPI003FA722E3
MPCYNEEKRLKENSILELINFKEPIDVFLINDGSTDNTLDFITNLSELNTNIKVIHFKKKRR